MQKIDKYYEYGDDKNPQYLVVFLHGYGSNGDNLIALAHDFSGSIKKAHFVSPNAPMTLSTPFIPSYQWFELTTRDPKVMYPQIIAANNILDEFIESQLKRFNLKHENLILIGFSQGAMMSLYNATRSKHKIAGVVAFSGRFICPSDLGEKVNSKPEICLIHGDADEVVHIENFFQSQAHLKELGFNFEAHEIKRMGHSINLSALKNAKAFLQKITK